jgi:DNA (cytosine-5)-methyltransferase 1
VLPKLVNAADYGVPQRRERVFIVAFRDDLGIKWSFPEETHSQKALWISQWITGEYWDRHKVPKGHRPTAPSDALRRAMNGDFFARAPWLTVRDALVELPDPLSQEGRAIPNHVLQPGARPYPGHTGSPLDEPAKTLKAGDHGVPGGENMMAFPDGRVRYFTVREAALLQTFPREFAFSSSWSENMRQIGNAVPANLARIIAEQIKVRLSAQASE